MIRSMKILFITSSRIGDAVLSTGLLEYMAQKWPDAKVTIACGPLVCSLFEACPQVERIIPLKKQKHNRHWLELWLKVVPTRWDIVVDLRNSLVSRLIAADGRYGFGGHIDPKYHKVEQNALVMKLMTPPSPKLWFSDAQQKKAKDLIPDGGPVLGVGPTANWAGKTWPVDRFAEIVKCITAPDGLMPGARVAVFGAPGEEAAAYELYKTIPADRALDLIAKGSPGEAAACLARCDFYIGNDSGLMHCAAAAGIPTLGLFGPSYPHLYRPWGPHTDYACTPESYDELIAFEGYDSKTVGSLMKSLSVDAVKDKLENFRQKLKAA